MREPKKAGQFKKDYKRMVKRHKDMSNERTGTHSDLF
jgi:mRNA-degrading endonuclease YafQ of YafQ-DinJ toxin-antitoxin module